MTATAVESISPKSSARAKRFRGLQQISILLLTLILAAISMLHARSIPNWFDNLLTYAAPIGIIACGMTFVMIAGGFDLSVGSITAVCGVVAVLMLKLFVGLPPWIAIPLAAGITVLVGALLGPINGILIAYVDVNPFVVTLSTMFVFRGIGLVLTSGGQSESIPKRFNDLFGFIYWGHIHPFGIPLSMPVIIYIAILAICLYLLRLTRLGHYVYATGGNAKASWLAGINVRAITAATYVISGITCAVTALIWTALSGTAQASDYQGREMIVIASVIVGGTPLSGGRGGLLLTVVGLFLLATIEQLLTQDGVNPHYRQLITGLIIVTVVALDAWFKRRKQ
ncbi:MAG TPA: ABC transporter permease [Tepidisphaeraceae bacterium]|nr:ABC transporter permease [Tepidisphaeraceae bacterium]